MTENILGKIKHIFCLILELIFLTLILLYLLILLIISLLLHPSLPLTCSTFSFSTCLPQFHYFTYPVPFFFFFLLFLTSSHFPQLPSLTSTCFPYFSILYLPFTTLLFILPTLLYSSLFLYLQSSIHSHFCSIPLLRHSLLPFLNFLDSHTSSLYILLDILL